MVYVSLLFVFFRADSLQDSWLIIKNIFTNFDLAYFVPFIKVRYVWFILMVLIMGAPCRRRCWHYKAQEWFVESPWWVKLVIFIIAVQWVIEFMTEDVTPFIYFQF